MPYICVVDLHIHIMSFARGKSVQYEHLVYEQEGRLLLKALAKCDRRCLCSWPKQNNIILIFIVDAQACRLWSVWWVFSLRGS